MRVTDLADWKNACKPYELYDPSHHACLFFSLLPIFTWLLLLAILFIIVVDVSTYAMLLFCNQRSLLDLIMKVKPFMNFDLVLQRLHGYLITT